MKALLSVLVACVSPISYAQAPAQTTTLLTLQQAEQTAIHNNPRIAVARLLALAQGQVTRETRAAEFPTITANLTAVDSHANSRITAGALKG